MKYRNWSNYDTPVTGPTYTYGVDAVARSASVSGDGGRGCSPQDQSLARRFYQQAVPLPLIESALLLASLRRLVRPADLPPLPPVRSLAYFQPVIAELQQQPLSHGYLDYLRLKFQQVARNLPNDAQKTTFPGDR